MKASRWGGRIVILGVISMLLAVVSLVGSYYDINSYTGVYLMTEFNARSDTFNAIASTTLNILVVSVFLSLSYIGSVLKGLKWPSFYLGGASCIVAISAATYFAYEASNLAEGEGTLAEGFLVLALSIAAQAASVVMRGWVLGGHEKMRLTEYIGDDPR